MRQVSALLDGGFQPATICAYMGYSPLLVRTVQRLKEDGGESLTPQFAGGPRKAAAENADVADNEEVPPAAAGMEEAGQHSLEGNGTGV